MSIISDFKNIFGNNNDGILYTIQNILNPKIDAIIIYSLQEQDFKQENIIATKPLEKGQFTSDSVQIKPFFITVKGYIYPTDDVIANNDFSVIKKYISDMHIKCLGYMNDNSVLRISNDFSYGVWDVKLYSISKNETTEYPIPEFVLTFMQVQSTSASNYSIQNISNPSLSLIQNVKRIIN